jgi:two-component system NtrC family sensor kinase
MRGRSRASPERVKSRRRKTTTPKRPGLRDPSATEHKTQSDLAQLTRERDEALEREKATAEVLRVISSSPGELEPVFQAMLESATRLCEAKFGNLFLYEGGGLRLVAAHNVPPAFAQTRRRSLLYPAPGGFVAEAIRTKQMVQVADLASTRAYAERQPTTVEGVELGGIRTGVAVPMLKGNELIGMIVIYRQEVRPFTDKQIALVQNFTAQAVIAIENTRLLHELRESLQQQTTTADVLKVVSRSTFDLQTGLDALTESAAKLCNAHRATILRQKGSAYFYATNYNFSPEFAEFAKAMPVGPGRGTCAGRVLLEGKTVHIHDVLADAEYTQIEGQRLGGYRTILGVPLLREGSSIGVIVLTRADVQPFMDKEIELVATFADQAVNRDRECAAVRGRAAAHARADRIPGAADRYRGGAQGHQPLDLRSPDGARYARPVCGTALRCR